MFREQILCSAASFTQLVTDSCKAVWTVLAVMYIRWYCELVKSLDFLL
jgi:hypothetical protein